MEENKCTYCGFAFDLQREHVIPAVWFGYRTFDSNEQWIVPACKQCNTYAGSKVFFSIPEKAAYLVKRYRSRAKQVLKTAFWTEEELDELSRILRIKVEESIKTKQLLLRRIAYIESVAELDQDYMRPVWVKNKLHEMQKEYDKIMKQLKKREKFRIQKQTQKTT